jgi:hypothetical protein
MERHPTPAGSASGAPNEWATVLHQLRFFFSQFAGIFLSSALAFAVYAGVKRGEIEVHMCRLGDWWPHVHGCAVQAAPTSI